MLELALVVPRVAHEQDPLARDPRSLGGLERGVEERPLGDESLGARVFELVGELVGRVGRVGRGGDAGGPVQAEVDDRGVDAVGGVEAEDVALAPIEGVDEALAEGDGEALYLGEGVGAADVAVYEEDWVVEASAMRGSFLNWEGVLPTVVIWIVPFPLQVQIPEVDVGDVDVCELGRDRHGAEIRWAITWLCVGLCYATKRRL